MRTWRLCFRKWVDPPNVLDGWIVPLTQAHVEQYMHDKNGHSYELIYCSKQIVQDAAYYFREGVVYADMDTIDKFVYDQWMSNLTFALIIVYVIITIVCIVIMLGAMSIAGGSLLYLLLVPAWPVLIPYFYYRKWRNQVEADAYYAKTAKNAI